MDCADSAEFAPNSTHHRIDAAIPKPEQPPNSRVVGSGIALGAPTQDAVCTSIAHICEAEGSRHAPPVTEMSRRTVTAPRLGRGSSRRPPPQGTTPLRYRTRTTVDLSTESGQLHSPSCCSGAAFSAYSSSRRPLAVADQHLQHCQLLREQTFRFDASAFLRQFHHVGSIERLVNKRNCIPPNRVILMLE